MTLKNNSLDTKYSYDELKSKIENDDPEIVNFIHQSTKSDAGTPAYWVKTRKSLETMVE